MKFLHSLCVVVHLALFMAVLSPSLAFADAGAKAATSISPGGAMENIDDGDSSFSWRGRSKNMFDNILAASPFFVRFRVRSRMVDEINRRGLAVVTEADLYKVVETVTPRLYMGPTLKAMEEAKK